MNPFRLLLEAEYGALDFDFIIDRLDPVLVVGTGVNAWWACCTVSQAWLQFGLLALGYEFALEPRVLKNWHQVARGERGVWPCNRWAVPTQSLN